MICNFLMLLIIIISLSLILQLSESIIVLDIYMSPLSSSTLSLKTFLNASLGLENLEEYSHQCDANGNIRDGIYRKRSDELIYTPNRVLQNETVVDGMNNKLQLGVILALGEAAFTVNVCKTVHILPELLVL